MSGTGGAPRLVLLDGVGWRGEPLPGERAASLLAVLVLHAGETVRDATLVDQVWDDDPPDHPAKALHVLVSRVRARTDATVVLRVEGGYRLGLADPDVDVLRLAALTRAARRALDAGDADAAVSLTAELPGPPGPDRPAGPLADLAERAARDIASARLVRGLALARRGDAVPAVPLLEEAHRARPDAVEVLVALLRSLARAVGTGAALDHYERHRAELAERLGTDPDPELQRLHRELLASDAPVRTGVLYQTDALLGRDQDLATLRAALAAGRLTTVLGPGGIGKTRIAQALARESTAPRVHVIELVGVASGDDVVAEVGAALGVRGSVTTRRTLTPAQQADVRARIVQELDHAPTLLVLDNCEHVLEPVAALVAFLLVSARELRVLATSRAPLRIAAEQVVPLSQLADADAAALFRRRALAVRPDAVLDPATVAAVVGRLDGLPLAVELAAARTRTMSVEEVRRGLEQRFELLRSRDRSSPERHRTLAAVIEWSWALLDTDAQRALAWLSVFHDGFDVRAATSVLGREAPDQVETLVEHSLLVVGEWQGSSRFRALETIREFAGARLVARGEQEAAREAQDRWAATLAESQADLLAASDQVERVDRLLAEENNLTDVLRRALDREDCPLVARLVATLATLWTVTGNQPRIFALADAAEDLLVGWEPPEQLRETARDALGILLVHVSWLPSRPLDSLRAALSRGGMPRTPWAQAAYVMFVEDGGPERLAALAEEAVDAPSAAGLLMWAALLAENSGDPLAALELARRALASGPLTPFLEASLHAEACALLVALGDHDAAAEHAEVAWPLLLRLHAHEDALSTRLATALAPLDSGDVAACARVLDEIEAVAELSQPASRMNLTAARAEVALRGGDVAAGLRLFDEAVAVAEEHDLGVLFSPWLLIAASAALVARVRHTEGGVGHERADELYRLLVERSQAARPGTSALFPDLPVNGVLLVAVAAWTLRHGDPRHHDDACRLLAVAERWAYNRSLPTLAWPPLVELAESRRPGLLDVLLAEYAGRPGRELVPEATTLLARVTSAG